MNRTRWHPMASSTPLKSVLVAPNGRRTAKKPTAAVSVPRSGSRWRIRDQKLWFTSAVPLRGSALQGILYIVLRVSLPVGSPVSHGYYPGADAMITFVELVGVRYVRWSCELTSRAHSKATAIPSEDHFGAGCHPAPRFPIIYYPP